MEIIIVALCLIVLIIGRALYVTMGAVATMQDSVLGLLLERKIRLDLELAAKKEAQFATAKVENK